MLFPLIQLSRTRNTECDSPTQLFHCVNDEFLVWQCIRTNRTRWVSNENEKWPGQWPAERKRRNLISILGMYFMGSETLRDDRRRVNVSDDLLYTHHTRRNRGEKSEGNCISFFGSQINTANSVVLFCAGCLARLARPRFSEFWPEFFALEKVLTHI